MHISCAAHRKVLTLNCTQKSINNMAFYKYVVWALVVIPTLVFCIIWYFVPHVIIGDETLNASLALSLIGVVLGYYSLIFSLYAALQVQVISDAYLFKIRSPELIKKLKKISKLVSDFGNEPSSDWHSQRFVSEVLVVLRSAKRVNNKHVKVVAAKAEKSLNTLKINMKSGSNAVIPAGQIPHFWDFYQQITELLDELNEQIEEVRASA